MASIETQNSEVVLAKKSLRTKKPKQKKQVLPTEEPKGFLVYVDDNFDSFCNYASDTVNEHASVGRFITYEDAVVKAQKIVESSLRGFYKSGMTQVELLENYNAFGDDPYIVPGPEKRPRFSAKNYARDIVDQVIKQSNMVEDDLSGLPTEC